MGCKSNTTSVVLQIRPMKDFCKQRSSWGRPNTDTGGEFTLSGTAACDRGHDCRRHRPNGALTAFDSCTLQHVSSVLADGGYSGKPFSEGVKQKLGASVRIAKRSWSAWPFLYQLRTIQLELRGASLASRRPSNRSEATR